MGLLEIILLVVILLMLVGSIPVYPYSQTWGYYPSGGLLALLLIVLILLLLF